jgi:hypothetical protein
VFLYVTRAGVNVRRRPDDTLELDTAIMTALKSYEVGFHFMPLPKQKSTEAKPQAATSYAPVAAERPSSWQQKGNHPYGKGPTKGKGKGKNKKTANILPQEL